MNTDLRVATSIIFGSIFVIFWKQAARAAVWPDNIKPWEALMGATWLLAGNRLTYAAAAQFDDNDPGIFAICQIYALVAGLLMLLAGIWAIRASRRQ